MALGFEWDEQKASQNIRNHKISFDEASTIFSDPLSIITENVLHSDEEERLIAIGQSARDKLLVVIHTLRGENVRIISARRATSNERTVYEEVNG